jgi:hypothetical protein
VARHGEARRGMARNDDRGFGPGLSLHGAAPFLRCENRQGFFQARPLAGFLFSGGGGPLEPRITVAAPHRTGEAHSPPFPAGEFPAKAVEGRGGSKPRPGQGEAPRSPRASDLPGLHPLRLQGTGAGRRWVSTSPSG